LHSGKDTKQKPKQIAKKALSKAKPSPTKAKKAPEKKGKSESSTPAAVIRGKKSAA